MRPTPMRRAGGPRAPFGALFSRKTTAAREVEVLEGVRARPERGSGRALRLRARPPRQGRAPERPPRRRGRSCATPGRSPGSSTISSPSRRVRARTSSSRAAFGLTADARRAVAYFGPGLESPWSAPGGPDEELDRDQCRDGVPRQPEDKGRTSRCESERLAGPDGDSQKSSSAPSSPRIRRTRSCGPTDTPPELTRRPPRVPTRAHGGAPPRRRPLGRSGRPARRRPRTPPRASAPFDS